MRYITSIERLAREEGREEGREVGREEGALRLLLHLLEHRLGELPDAVVQRVHRLSLAQMEALVDPALSAESLAVFAVNLPEERLAG